MLSIRLSRTLCRTIAYKLFAELSRNNKVTFGSSRVTIDCERSLSCQDITGDSFFRIIGGASDIFVRPLKRSLGVYEVNVTSGEVLQCYASHWQTTRKNREESLDELR